MDIRSDLYSLGVVLWEMLTGYGLFRSSRAELMYLHQQAPLPLEQLKAVPQPVVVLIEMLLEKDPSRRFQTPAELLKVMPTITHAIDEGRTIIGEALRQLLTSDSHAVTRKPSTRLGSEKISIAKLPITRGNPLGREEDIAFLDEAWANPDVNIVTILAGAGVGKSALVNHWLQEMAAEDYRSAQLVFGWSFDRQVAVGNSWSADEFLDAALPYFGDRDPKIGTSHEKGERLANLIAHRRSLLVLDGLELCQNPHGPEKGRLREPSLQALLRELAAFNAGLCVVTTRLPVAEIADDSSAAAIIHPLQELAVVSVKRLGGRVARM